MSVPSDLLLIPEFTVKLDGQALDSRIARQLHGISVEQSIELPGRFALELQVSDDWGADRSWFDRREPFTIGSAIDVAAGHVGGDQKPLLAGEITALDAEFVADAPPRLTVRGYDRRHRLQRGRSIRTYSKMKDSDIARKIAQEAGIAIEVVDSRVLHEYLIQANQSDFEFLQERARRIGFELLMDGPTLRFRPLGHLAGPSVTLSMADGGLLELRVQLSAAGQVSEASVRGWDVKRKQSIVGVAQRGRIGAMGSTDGAALTLKAFGKAQERVATQPVAGTEEADQAAQAALDQLVLPLVRAEGLCPGRPALQAGKVIRVTDAGERFDGSYYVAAAQHRWGPESGYTTRFSAWRNAT